MNLFNLYKLMKKVKSRLGELWWYAILLFVAQRFGDIANMAVGMWLVPKYVSQDDLGAVLPLMNFTSLIALPLTFISVPFLRFITEFCDKKEYGKAKCFIRDVFVGIGVFSLFTVILSIFVFPFMFERIRVEKGSLGILIVISCLVGAMSGLFGNMMQGFKMYNLSVIIFAVSAPFRFVFMMLLVPFRPLSGYVAGQSAGSMVSVIGAIVVFKRYLGRSVRIVSYWKEYGNKIIKYTLPMVVWIIVITITSTVDTLVVRHRLSLYESAGFYVITRFSDIAAYLGTAFGVFIFPMVASSKNKDEKSLRVLCHSVLGSAVVGVLFSVCLAIWGDKLLMMSRLWCPYIDLANSMALLAFYTTLVSVANCFITYETAQSRFRFLWYAIPIMIFKAIFLYSITGYTFFDRILPSSIIETISQYNPCRLSVVVIIYVVVQYVLVCCLIGDVFGDIKKGKEK
jgi:O-antigen/teichoic acid export membrane protein